MCAYTRMFDRWKAANALNDQRVRSQDNRTQNFQTINVLFGEWNNTSGGSRSQARDRAQIYIHVFINRSPVLLVYLRVCEKLAARACANYAIVCGHVGRRWRRSGKVKMFLTFLCEKSRTLCVIDTYISQAVIIVSANTQRHVHIYANGCCEHWTVLKASISINGIT